MAPDYVSEVGLWHSRWGLQPPVYEFQRRAEAKEGWLSCPFDKSHMIPKDRLEAHVRKCRIRFDPNMRLRFCPYSIMHVLKAEHYQEHISTCALRPKALRVVDYGFGPVYEAVEEAPPAPPPKQSKPKTRSKNQAATALSVQQHCLAKLKDGTWLPARIQAISPDGDIFVVKWTGSGLVASLRRSDVRSASETAGNGAAALAEQVKQIWPPKSFCIARLPDNGFWYHGVVESCLERNRSIFLLVQIASHDRVLEIPWQDVRPIPPTNAPLFANQPVFCPIGADHFASATILQVDGTIALIRIDESHSQAMMVGSALLPMMPAPPSPDISQQINAHDGEIDDEEEEEEEEEKWEQEDAKPSSQRSTGSSYESLRMRTEEEMAWECRLVIADGTVFHSAAFAKTSAKQEAARKAWEERLLGGTITPMDIGLLDDSSLPEFSLDGEVVVTANAQDCDQWIQKNVFNSQQKLVGFDTEWTAERAHYSVALIQIASANSCLLFSTSAMKNNQLPKNLCVLLQRPDIVKTGVDLEQDQLNIKQQYGLRITNAIDLADEAVPLGFARSAGTKRLCVSLLKMKLSVKDKTIATSNWSAWPLSHTQIVYAATDAVIARLLAIEIERRLASMH